MTRPATWTGWYSWAAAEHRGRCPRTFEESLVMEGPITFVAPATIHLDRPYDEALAWQLEDGLLAWRLAVLHVAICIAQERLARLEDKIHMMRLAGGKKSDTNPYSRAATETLHAIQMLGQAVELLAPIPKVKAHECAALVDVHREATIHARAMLMVHKGWTTWSPDPRYSYADYPLGTGLLSGNLIVPKG